MAIGSIFTPGTEAENLAWIVSKIDWDWIERLTQMPQHALSEHCPCCGLVSPPDTIAPPTYNICVLCNWEDDGDEAEQVYTGANAHTHQTQNRARRIVETVRALAKERFPSLRFLKTAVIDAG